MICDYIKFFPGQLNALISREDERNNRFAYIKRTGMNKVSEWAKKVEILATAKCLKRDIITFHRGNWRTYSYVYAESDAIYLDNQSGLHFNVVLAP